jgi:hypothetical protein
MALLGRRRATKLAVFAIVIQKLHSILGKSVSARSSCSLSRLWRIRLVATSPERRSSAAFLELWRKRGIFDSCGDDAAAAQKSFARKGVSAMAKEQRRGNREAKKPKQVKSVSVPIEGSGSTGSTLEKLKAPNRKKK